MFKVVEIAEKLGVSKVSVYNKIKQYNKELKPHLSKLKGVTYIDKQGFKIIKESFNLFNQAKTKDTGENHEATDKVNDTNSLNSILKVKNEQLKGLKDHIQYLENQIQVKDDLIKDQNKQLENFQVLLLNEQKRNKLLEGKIEESQTEKEMAVATEEKLGFFQRWLRKRGK